MAIKSSFLAEVALGPLLVFSPVWLSLGWMMERKEELQWGTPLAKVAETALGANVSSTWAWVVRISTFNSAALKTCINLKDIA